MDTLPQELVGYILDELNFLDLKKVRGVCKAFYEQYSKRCNWYIKTRVQEGEILELDAIPIQSIVVDDVIIFYHENFPKYLVKSKELRADGWYVNLHSTAMRLHSKKLTYDEEGMLVAENVYYQHRINFH
jgi:hypothetical protein